MTKTATEKSPKNPKYLCEICKYITNNKKDYLKHILTPKHKKSTELLILSTEMGILSTKFEKCTTKIPKNNVQFNCIYCDKVYKDRSGLWRHNKKCKENPDNIQNNQKNTLLNNTYTEKNGKEFYEKLMNDYEPEIIKKAMKEYNENYENKVYYECNPIITDKDLILKILNSTHETNEIIKNKDDIIGTLLQDNKEFKTILIEALNKPNSIMNNCNNKTQFNLQFFLNETCKNAMNMQDFIESIKINHEEWENMGKLGYVQGVTNVFIKALGDLDETERPVHCTDKKREIFYIKDNNVWEKEGLIKTRLRFIIKMILHRCIQFLTHWKDENPSWSDIDSKKHSLYMKSLNQITTGITPDDDFGISKIIRTIAGCVWVNK